MTSSHGRRIQSRRALAILTWATLVVVAVLLWYGQQNRTIRTQAWEPAALLLSAYATFLSIFGWLLFCPARRSAEESPGLFFSGMLTLLPPCFIAYHLMPVNSPLKPWLTIGVFLFGVLAIMSPLPDEVFAVPRDRRSYLQPLTNSFLYEVDANEPEVTFDDLAPQTAHWLSRPSKEQRNPDSGSGHDPWTDPFHGTGRQMSRIGASQSRRTDETKKQDRRRPVDSQSTVDSYRGVRETAAPAESMISQVSPGRRLAESVNPESTVRDSDRNIPSPGTTKSPLPPVPVTGAHRMEQTPGVPTAPPIAPMAAAVTARRPLSEPAPRSMSPVGFQTPVPQPRSMQPLPPPLPASALPIVSVPPEASVPPMSSPSMASLSAAETSIPARSSLRELDRQIREQEAADEEDSTGNSVDEEDTAGTHAFPSAPGVTRSVQQSSADIRLERIRDEHGGEMIEGTIGVFFEVGQKRAHLHVPFSPPLPGLPEVECEPAGEDSIRVKVAVRQPYGIRIEARRSDASEALKSEVSFAAVYTPSPRRG